MLLRGLLTMAVLLRPAFASDCVELTQRQSFRRAVMVFHGTATEIQDLGLTEV